MANRGDYEVFHWVSGSMGCGKRRKETHWGNKEIVNLNWKRSGKEGS